MGTVSFVPNALAGRLTHVGTRIEVRWKVIYEYHEVSEGIDVDVVNEGLVG
jgi:hypothetical protein